MSTLAERLRALFPEASGRSIGHWLAGGRVRVDGEVVRDSRVALRAGARVVLGPPSPVVPGALRLLHEDDQLVVIDKPPGLLTIATEGERDRTAYRLLWDYLAAKAPRTRPWVVHRLDRDTSGLVVFARTKAAKGKLQAQFEARSVERIYVAVVEGVVRADQGTLTSRLVQDENLRVRVAGGGDRAASRAPAREAITHYRVLERRRDTTVLELALGTGRRRQIRVQLGALGHPVLGDRDHGGRRKGHGRLWLHATRLAFVHPATGRRVVFDCPPPPGFRRGGAPLRA